MLLSSQESLSCQVLVVSILALIQAVWLSEREGVADVILADGDRAQGWAGPFGDRDDYSWRHACLQS